MSSIAPCTFLFKEKFSRQGQGCTVQDEWQMHFILCTKSKRVNCILCRKLSSTCHSGDVVALIPPLRDPLARHEHTLCQLVHLRSAAIQLSGLSYLKSLPCHSRCHLHSPKLFFILA